MYASVGTVQIQPGKMETAISIFRESVVPAVKQLKGFKGVTLLTDRNTGKAIATVLYETEADARSPEAATLYQESVAKGMSVFAGPPVREFFEVSVKV